MPRRLKGGGRGGAELLGFGVLLPLPGFEMSGSEGRGFRGCSGGEERSSLACWLVGRGTAGREPGGRSAALPTVFSGKKYMTPSTPFTVLSILERSTCLVNLPQTCLFFPPIPFLN